MNKISWPKFAKVFGKNGEMEFAVIFGTEQVNEVLRFKCLISQDLQNLDKKRKI